MNNENKEEVLSLENKINIFQETLHYIDEKYIKIAKNDYSNIQELNPIKKKVEKEKKIVFKKKNINYLKPKNKEFLGLATLILLFVISIGFAFVTTNISMLGNLFSSSKQWDIQYENLKYSGSGVAYLEDNQISFEATYGGDGNTFEFSFDVVNNGSIDAMIGRISILFDVYSGSSLVDDHYHLDYYTYELTYENYAPVKKYEILRKNSKVRMVFKITLLNNAKITTKEFDLSFVNATEKAIEPDMSGFCGNDTLLVNNNTICKRANILQQESCPQLTSYSPPLCSQDGFAGSTIVYGNCGEKGILETGDAFVCDVNGDEYYDESKEKFYYVSSYYDSSEKTFNDQYAVLIYSDSYAELNNFDSSNVNGLSSVLNSLPNSSSWPNVSLYKTTRQLVNENAGTTSLAGNLNTVKFDNYPNVTTRLLTLQELMNGCGTTLEGTIPNRCLFMLQKTSYVTGETWSGTGVWLENPASTTTGSYWYINANGRNTAISSGYNPLYLKPVIEVPIDRMAY